MILEDSGNLTWPVPLGFCFTQGCGIAMSGAFNVVYCHFRSFSVNDLPFDVFHFSFRCTMLPVEATSR